MPDDTVNFDVIEKQLDGMIESGQLPSAAIIDDWIEEKASSKGHKSKLKVRRTMNDLAYSGLYFQYLRDYARGKDAVPVYGSLDRDHYLSAIWKSEPILAGAVYSMSAKMVSLKWQISGRRNLAIYYAKLLSRAAYMGGYGWGGFSSPSAEDFYTTDRGVFWETARVGNPMYGKLADIGHIDALQCTLTGNTKRPIHYMSALTGQSIRFKPGEVAHFASMNSPREEYLGMGLCAVSRALRAAKLLMGLHDYDAEKLANLPPEGVAAITGLTIEEFHDALALWQSSREKDNSLTFPQVLWLIGSQPNSVVKVDFVGFSQLPESFDRQTVIQQYINTLALDFGVDTREFWAISSGALGTASETEVQHMKAKGKGHGEYITLTERILNDEMPDGVEFGYDTQDIEEDETAARVAKAWVDAFLPLTIAGGAAEAIIDNEMLLRLLADKSVIPDWMVKDDRVVADDMGVHEKDFTHDDVIVIEWDGRILRQKYSAAIDLSYRVVGRKQKKLPPDALDITPPTELKVWEYRGGDGSSWESTDAAVEFLKQAEAALEEEPERNIRGKPIPEDESLRGASVTQSAIDHELELWRNHPLLSHYLPKEEVKIG